MATISIPSTDVDLTLDQLVSVSLQNNYSATVFGKLFREFKHRATASNQELDLRCLLAGSAQSPEKLKYVQEILVDSDYSEILDGLGSLFGQYLVQLDEIDQLAVLMWLNQISYKVPWQSSLEAGLFYTGFETFINNNINQEISPKKALMIAKIVINLLGNVGESNEAFGTLIQRYLEFLKQKHPVAYAHLDGYYKTHSITSIQKDYKVKSESQIDKKTSRNSIKILRLKKLVWLSQQVTILFSVIDDSFLKGFKTLLNLSSVATSATNTSIAFELTASLFDGLALSTKRTGHFWTTFIVFKLPEVFKLLNISQQNLRDTLTNVFETIRGHEEVKSRLLKSLVECELVTNEDEKIVPADLSPFRSILIDANPEFVTLEESRASEFFSSVQTLAGQTELAGLVTNAISKFINEDDHSRLKRILVALAADVSVMDGVFLLKNPYELVGSLVEYLDSSIERGFSQDAMDIDGDSSNLQDVHSDLGAIIVVVAYTSFRYCLDLKSRFPSSETGRILVDWDPILDTAVMEKLQDPESNLNAVMGDWIVSLFDTNNTDGVSDELLKKSSVREYYLLIPCVVSEGVRASQLGMIQKDDLMSGLEYCHQPFLIPTFLNVLRSLLALAWTEPNLDTSMVSQVLKTLVDVNLSGELHILHRMIVEIVNDELYEVGSVKNVLQPPAPPTRLDSLIAFLVEPDSKHTFELVAVYEQAQYQQLDFFYNQLDSLLEENTHGQASLVEPLIYELVVTLMISYTKLKAPESLQKWLAVSSDPEAVYNRTGSEKVSVEQTVLEPETSDKLTDMGFDTNFFGFIEEPKDDEPDFVFDQEQVPTVPGSDLYLANFAAIAKESSPLVATVLRNLNIW